MPIVEIASEREGDLPDYINRPDVAFHCRVRNEGNGPAYLQHWSTSGDQPGFGTDKGYFQLVDSNYRVEISYGTDRVMIPPEEEISIFTGTGVMYVESDKIEESCSQTLKNATFTFSVHTISGDTISQQLEYTYEKNDNGECILNNLSMVNEA